MQHAIRTAFFVWLIVCPATLVSAQPSGYYAPAAGKDGEELKEALHEIIDDHTVLSYSNLWTAFRSTDKRDDGTVWDMYSDVPGGDPQYVYTFGTDQCGNYSGEGSCYNREHSFPKSWFNDDSPMNTDLFHLYPTDGYVNGKRSNFPYGETDNASWTSSNGCEVGPSSVNGYSGTIFEPIDTYKGDFARTYFYMATRYYGEDAGWPGSPMVDGAQLEPWAQEMMLRWHDEDPVSEKETERNDAVYALQGNRNPFIDHPEFVQLIYVGAQFDEIPPILDSIMVTSATGVALWFNEPLDIQNASDASHYGISGGVQVVTAVPDPGNQANVSLVVAGLVNGTYTLTLSGVSDTAGNVLQSDSISFEVTSLSTAVWGPEGASRIYPNPANGTFFLETGEYRVGIDQVRMFDLTGKAIPAQWEQDAGTIRVTTTAEPGSYVVVCNAMDKSIWRFPVLIY